VQGWGSFHKPDEPKEKGRVRNWPHVWARQLPRKWRPERKGREVPLNYGAHRRRSGTTGQLEKPIAEKYSRGVLKGWRADGDPRGTLRPKGKNREKRRGSPGVHRQASRKKRGVVGDAGGPVSCEERPSLSTGGDGEEDGPAAITTTER